MLLHNGALNAGGQGNGNAGSPDPETDNALADELFRDSKALMWERRQSDSHHAPNCRQTREALETSGAASGKRNRLVMGHTPQFNGVSKGSYNFRKLEQETTGQSQR